MHTHRTVALIFLLARTLLAAHPAEAGEAVLYRDGWGVPHIRAESDSAAAHAFGYAQAEDRLEAILRNYLWATGSQASVFGETFLDEDFEKRLWRHEERARDAWTTLSTDARGYVAGFVAGINRFIQDHPERVPAWAFPIQPHHPLALARVLALEGGLRQADAELRRELPDHPRAERRSAGLWALAPERSAEDGAVLHFDIHGTWESPRRWYEAHIHGGSIHAWGWTCPGLPVILHGHNRHLAWVLGPGGPDVADVYRISLEGPAATRYRYGDAWRQIATRPVRIPVLRSGKRVEVDRLTQSTPDGPIIRRDGATAYVYRLADAAVTAQIDQFLGFMRASTYAQFRGALAEPATGPASLLYADDRGRLFFAALGRVPRRSEMFSWDRPVSGNTPDTDWKGTHDLGDLVQLADPSAGWIQACGSPPSEATAASPMTPDRFPVYIYNASGWTDTPRSARARQVLSASPRMTLTEATELALETYVIHSDAYRLALSAAVGDVTRPPLSQAESRALEHLLRWDGRADTLSTAAPLYRAWRGELAALETRVDDAGIRAHLPLGPASRDALVSAFRKTVTDVAADSARADATWGEVHRYRRWEHGWPLAGADPVHMPTMRVTTGNPGSHDGDATAGSHNPSIVVFDGPGKVRSFSAVPFGQSDHPDSPHAWDQGAALFSRSRLKPTRFDTKPADLKESIRLTWP